MWRYFASSSYGTRQAALDRVALPYLVDGSLNTCVPLVSGLHELFELLLQLLPTSHTLQLALQLDLSLFHATHISRKGLNLGCRAAQTASKKHNSLYLT